MAIQHDSGLPYAINRSKGRQDLQSVVFYGRRSFVQGGELNDMQEIIRGRHDRLGRLVAKDGDRVENGIAVVDREAETVTLTAGTIYVAGDVMPVEERVFTAVPMAGRIEFGVRLVKHWVTAEDDPELKGQIPGSLAEGEDGAAREVVELAWARSTDGAPGQFYQVYVLQDGAVLEQNAPALLDGVTQALAVYDRPHGSYIVSGFGVSVVDLNAGTLVFSIQEGEANVNGFKTNRQTSLRFEQEEEWDVGAVPGETHTYAGGASHTFTVNEGPIDTITSILLTKERTVTLTRGALANGIDALPDTSVVSIVSIAGYTVNTSYVRTGNGVDWAPAGPEPAAGTSYNVTYRYRDNVSPSAFTVDDITVAGGAAGGDIIVSYTFKLPRIDIIGLRQGGTPVYIEGVSARKNPVAPQVPGNVLGLAEVHNDWRSAPTIVADGVVTGVRIPTYGEIRRYFNAIEDQSRLLQLERLRAAVDRRDPAAKKNMFVDPFEGDFYRDAGEAQNGAVGDRLLQLAIVPTFYDADLDAPVTLDWVEEVIVSQELKSFCEKINPYQNFTPMPGTLELTPSADFWTERATQWLSDQTLEFQRGIVRNARTTTETRVDVVRQTETALPFLRPRAVAFKVSGFFPGETLSALTFDGVSVLPGGGPLAANGDGVIEGTFTIPANIVAGSKKVRAIGAVSNGTRAESTFTGHGVITTDVMRRTTTINTWDEGGGGTTIKGNDDDRDDGLWNGRVDPQAQFFLLPATRQLLGVDFHLCAIGDVNNTILVHQVDIDNGYPTENIRGEALVNMQGATVGWKSARYGLPVTTSNSQDQAFLIKTDDGQHAISIAGLGGFDTALQKPITAHPFPVGPRFSSVNGATWSAHQGEALAFRLVAARYPVATKTVELGDFDLVNASDLQVRAVVDLPSPACSVVFELERANGVVYRLLPYQVLQLSEFLTETVTLRAVLTGTNELSPVLFNPVELIAGRLQTTGVYITRAFSIDDAVRVTAYLRLSLPGGSTAAMHCDLADDNWQVLTLDSTELSPDPAWVERKYTKGGLAADLMRIRITLTGTPAARPMAADFGLGAM